MATELLYHLITNAASQRPDNEALKHKNASLTYAQLAMQLPSVAAGLQTIGLARFERLAIYLPKCFEYVLSCYGTAMAGGVFVPINPLLKSPQVSYILKDCNTRVLITSSTRLAILANSLSDCHDLQAIVLTDCNASADIQEALPNITFYNWDLMTDTGLDFQPTSPIDADMAAIFYTSGSTGKPKGVILSHRNMVSGAKSVSTYLDNHASDRILAVLPFSFDYGFSQLTTAFYVGATVVMMDYLLPQDVIRTVDRECITGLAAVPPLWIQLAQLDWPTSVTEHLRYLTNSGGTLPHAALDNLRQALPKSSFFLMYGLTEAFRSTYLPPEEIDRHPGSIGKAIPNAEIMVVREDGSLCAPGEPGELVHRGSLVAMGYWNKPEKTSEHFKPVPSAVPALPLSEIAVWSGDTVKMDAQGYLYFINRKDDLIKTSGYRVSPTEVEEVIYASRLVTEVVALGVPHPRLGQAIIVVATAAGDSTLEGEALINHCKQELPGFMLPLDVLVRNSLPLSPNGKVDRKLLASELNDYFSSSD